MIRQTLTAALIVGSLFAAADHANAAVQYDCTHMWTTNSGHTAKVRCDDGPQQEYRVIVEFCGATGCYSAKTPWTRYGYTASVTSSTAYADTSGYGLLAR